VSSAQLAEADELALDHPIWSALTGHHQEIALGGHGARRYPPEIGPLAAMREATPENFDALAALIPADDHVALFTVDRVAPPPNLAIQLAAFGYQMIATGGPIPAPASAELIRLGAADALDMLRLVELTRPGPLGARTHELGEYIGIRSGRELVAMAGERMRFGRFAEISAVCVHPDHRGKGYAQILMLTLMRKLVQREIVPILHVFADNAGAIALYERLGFAIRRRFHVTVLHPLR
jgi:ribosomal protein S18 acetylase RimI-like enzyme